MKISVAEINPTSVPLSSATILSQMSVVVTIPLWIL
jgi:hypothetical protein